MSIRIVRKNKGYLLAIIIGILAFIGAITSKPDKPPLNKDQAAIIDNAITGNKPDRDDKTITEGSIGAEGRLSGTVEL